MGLGSDERHGKWEQVADERKKLNQGVQEELKSRKAVRVKVKVGQRERVLDLRHGMRRDQCQFEVI